MRKSRVPVFTPEQTKAQRENQPATERVPTLGARAVAAPHANNLALGTLRRGLTPLMDENEAAQYWRIRSSEVASIAKIAGDDEDREDLLRIAAIFEGMAERARERGG